MRICPDCGKQYNVESRFCPDCGVPTIEQSLPEAPQKETPKKVEPKPKKRLGLWLILTAILAVVITAAVLFLSWYNSDEQKIIRALESGNYQDALEIVQNNDYLRSDEDMVEMLQERIAEAKKKYVSSQITYAQLNEELDAIAEMKVKKVTSDVEELREYAKMLNESRTYFATAEDFFASGDYAESLKYYCLVIEEDTNYSSAKEKIAEAQNKYRQGVLTEADKYAQNGEYEFAIAVLEDGLKVLPEDNQINRQIAVYEKNNEDQIKQTALDSSAAYAASGDYLSAITVLEEYLKGTPDDVVITQKLQTYKAAYETQLRDNTLRQAADYASYNDYLAAMQVLNNYIDIYGDHVDITVAYNGYKESYVTTVIAEAEEVAQHGDYVGAMEMVNGAMEQVSDSRLNSKYSSYENSYVDVVISESDGLLAKKDYEGALEVVKAAQTILPYNQRLQTQAQKIVNAMPKNLLDVCQPYESFHYEEYKDGRCFTMASKEYSDGFVLGGGYYDDAYAYFNMSGTYSYLSFQVGHIDGTDMDDAVIKLYFDGVLIKEISMKATGMPVQYEFEITGVNQVVFYLTDVRYVYYGFANVTVQ